MKLARGVLIAVGAVWLLLLVVWPVYVEPGNGHIGCGRSWRGVATDEFLEEACHRAIEHRRIVMLAPTFILAAGLALTLAGGRRGQPDSR